MSDHLTDISNHLATREIAKLQAKVRQLERIVETHEAAATHWHDEAVRLAEELKQCCPPHEQCGKGVPMA